MPHNEAIKEISVESFSRVMRSTFNIMNERVAGRPFAVRYTGPPYDHSDDECRSTQVSSHAKGTMFCPLVIFAVLEKFDIPEDEYADAIKADASLTTEGVAIAG